MSDELVQHVCDLLAPLGPSRSRCMFGGYGLYLHDVMVGLIADDVLYLKTDDENRARFEAAALPPFTYRRTDSDTPYAMSYHQAPPEGLDDGALLCDWAAGSLDAARRAAAKKRGRAKKPPPPRRS